MKVVLELPVMNMGLNDEIELKTSDLCRLRLKFTKTFMKNMLHITSGCTSSSLAELGTVYDVKFLFRLSSLNLKLFGCPFWLQV